MTTTRIAIIALAGMLAAATTLHAHATYNLNGNTGSGIAGSVPPGAPNDGGVTSDPATWTNGPVDDYTGSLPVNWYAGMHPTELVPNNPPPRTIQSGLAPNPPNGSFLQQVNDFNASSPPAPFPVDRVLAIGGASWSDPANDGQGWGMGLDYGLIHFSPLDEIVAAGPVKFTITLQDDPTDGIAPQLAFALYGGWDTGATSDRHQPYVTNPAPDASDPLGSTGLTLIDFAVATGPGRPLTRGYTLDTTYGGHYTVFIGALGGVSGQYQLTVSTFPDVELGACEEGSATQLAACTATLDTMRGELEAATADADGDGRRNQDDRCPETPAGAVVDQSGCSQAQFCGGIAVASKAGRTTCKKADWQNDEPLLKKKKDLDCVYSKSARACQPSL